MLYAVIDIGSTTMRMAIYQISPDKLELVHKRKYTVGLAAYVQDGRMTTAGIDKACEILAKFQSFLISFNIKNVPIIFNIIQYKKRSSFHYGGSAQCRKQQRSRKRN